MGAIKGNIDLTNTTDQAQFFRFCSALLNDVVAVINGGIEISSQNMNLRILSCTFTAANTAQTFTHSLGRSPVSYIQCKNSVAMTVYDSSVAATKNTITLKSSATGTVSLIIF